ncbi:MAG: small multi-drug resistant family protein [Rhodopila sp.]
MGIWLLALGSIGLSAVAQLLMKIGMTAVRTGASGGSADMLLAAVLNPYVIGGLGAYGLSAVLWLLVLSRLPLSLAYPLVSLGFIVVVVLSALILHEPVSVVRLAGVALIVGGVVVLGLSA